MFFEITLNFINYRKLRSFYSKVSTILPKNEQNKHNVVIPCFSYEAVSSSIAQSNQVIDPYRSFSLVCISSSHSCLFSRRTVRLFVRISSPPSWRLVSRGFSCSHRNWNFSTSPMKFSTCVIRLLLIPSTYRD